MLSVKLQTVVRNEPKVSVMKLSHGIFEFKKTFDLGSENYFNIASYYLQIILFESNLLNPIQFDVLPTTKFVVLLIFL